MKTRPIAAAILAALLAGTFASCGGTSDPAADDTSAAPVSGENGQTDDSPFVKDDLPALDFGGKKIRVLYRDDLIDSFCVAEQTGDLVDDAVYKANRAVEERLNVLYDVTLLAGSASADRNNYINHISNAVLAGDDAYDLVSVMTYYMPTLIRNGVLSDLMKNKYLDFDKPWWVADLTSLASQYGRLYFASGDISLELMQRTYCMLFNKKLAADLGTEDLYQLVLDGKWTLDAAERIAKATYQDLNGNSEVDPEDRYGLVVTDYNHATAFVCSNDLLLTTPDADGIQHIDCGNERAADIVQRMVRFTNETTGIFYQTQSDAGSTEPHQPYYRMFKDDRLLLATAEFDQICTTYRDMKSEFGVIPYPKYDENQSDYYSMSRNTYSSFAIPKTCADPDMVGAVMEAQASENYRSTSQVYFETALKVKYSRDDMTSQMFDIIKEGLKFNFAVTFSLVAGTVQSQFTRSMVNNNPNWASTYASLYESSEAALQSFYADVAGLE